MIIQVQYLDNSFDYVKDRMLFGLIESGGVTKFKRSSGWVTVGIDPIRKTRREHDCSLSHELKKRA